MSDVRSLEFILGDGVRVQVLVTERDDGTLFVSLEVIDGELIGDATGVFFDVADESLLSGLRVTGAGTATIDAEGVTKISGENWNNLNGTGMRFDVGVSIGDNGLGGKTDVREASFVLSHESQALTLDFLAGQEFGVRLLSVGEEGEDREDSAKLVGTAPEAPLPASLGDRVWFDADKDGVQDDGETGVADVTVQLKNASGTVVATATTDASGNYLFDNLVPGDYSVAFVLPSGYAFTQPGQGDGAADSDADPSTGMTGIYNLEAGETDLSVDAGIYVPNGVPTPQDDAGKGCANEEIAVDVIDNDSDPDGDSLMVSAVNGIAISDGQTIEVDGVFISLDGDELIFNGEAAYEDLDIGEKATVSFTYTVKDGNGGSADANVEVTFCGVAETLQEICDSLPSSISYQIINEYGNGNSEAFTLKLDGSGDARLDGLVIEAAYCVSAFDPAVGGSDFTNAPVYTANVYCAIASEVPDAVLAGQIGGNGQSAEDNLDLVNWILNQDFSNNGYTDAEVQAAIWNLTDSIDFVPPAYGDLDDVREIVALAEANGEGFEAGAGDIIGILIDPDPATPENSQPLVLGIAFDSLDCIC